MGRLMLFSRVRDRRLETQLADLHQNLGRLTYRFS